MLQHATPEKFCEEASVRIVLHCCVNTVYIATTDGQATSPLESLPAFVCVNTINHVCLHSMHKH